MELYAYVTCITELTIEDATVVALDSYTESNFGPVLSSNSPGMLLGCAYQLFQLVPLVSDFWKRQRHSRLPLEKPPIDNNDWYRSLKEYSALHSQISSWEPPPDATLDFANGGRLYQEALLAYLELSNSGAADLEIVKNRTDAAMALLYNIAGNAPIAVTLCWPLSLFASITINLSYRETIRQRFQQMYHDLGFGNMLTIIEYLDRLWDEKQMTTTLQKEYPAQSTSLHSLTRKHQLEISFL